MAIKVSGVTVVDNDRNLNIGILTATSLDVPPQPITFSPTDGSSDVSLSSNIVITYNADVSKGSGNIQLLSGSASGTVIETIAVSSGSVTISGGEVTINPSDFPTGKDIYVVVDEGAFVQSVSTLGGSSALLNTYNFTTGPITTSSFSPTDGATNVVIGSNIVITFSENITKGTGNITLRSGSASGTIRQTIDVTSGAVSVSGNQATINPPSNLEYEEDTYIVVDAGCFRNSDGDVASGNAIINTYNFTTETDLSLGDAFEGGYLICCSSNNYWIVAPSATEISTRFHYAYTAANTAAAATGCAGWFVPTSSQLVNPGYTCRTYWDSYKLEPYWSNSNFHPQHNNAYDVDFSTGSAWNGRNSLTSIRCVRAFRCVSY